MPPSFPAWLHVLAVACLALGVASAVAIALDEVRRPQPMWIMGVVWPVTALFGGLLWLAFYFAAGRTAASRSPGGKSHEPPMALAVAKGTCHCGAGCTLGDIVAEWLAFAVPGIAVAFGWHRLFGERMFAVWVLDFLLAFALGILFQYYSIKPMRNLTVRDGIVQALKADAASITAWQVGMYGFMAAAQLAWLRPRYGATAAVNTPEFWFVMQIAMLCGFCTSYPVNWLLIRAGVKERM